jgi:hypothetical protein
MAFEALVEEAGLEPVKRGEVDSSWASDDEETMVRGLLAAGPAVRAIDVAGETAVREATRAALGPYGTRIENRRRYVIAETT